jgi:dipeptidyl aminopeptidase/acylaminoacyl peptidase
VRIDGRQGADAVRPATRLVTNLAIPPRQQALLYANWESASSPARSRSSRPNGQGAGAHQVQSRARAQLDLPPIENFWFTSSRGKAHPQLLVRPPGFDPSKKYPLFV